jgi:hypothetical protein
MNLFLPENVVIRVEKTWQLFSADTCGSIKILNRTILKAVVCNGYTIIIDKEKGFTPFGVIKSI